MAKQAGEKYITGNLGGVCFYKMNGRYYARMGSSLTGKRVKRDPAFKRTMQLAEIFGKANKIASELYRKLPPHEKGRDVRYELIRKCRKLLAEGFSCEATKRMMCKKVEHVAVGEKILEKVEMTLTKLEMPVDCSITGVNAECGKVLNLTDLGHQ